MKRVINLGLVVIRDLVTARRQDRFNNLSVADWERTWTALALTRRALDAAAGSRLRAQARRAEKRPAIPLPTHDATFHHFDT